ncbi:hypothetical protein LXL04_005695 [Taraxacum kok-saghyz]
MSQLGRPPPAPPPPPPPLSPEIEENNGGTLERQMTESQRSLWEKEASFNCRLEWRYLGYSEIGYNTWVAISLLGPQQWNLTKHFAIRVIEKVNPHIIKCFKIAATAKPPGSSSTLLFMCNSESISEIRKKDSYKLCSTDDLFWVAILSVHVDALIPFDKMNQQRNPTSTTKSICQCRFFQCGFKTYSNRGYENKTRALMARMKTGNNWQPKFDSYHIVLGGYMDCKKKSALHTMLNQINVKMQDLFDKLWGRNSNKKIALGSCFRNTNTVGADVSMMRQWGVGLYSTYLFTEKYVVRALIKEDITKYVCNVPGDNVGFKVKNVVVKYLKHRYVTSNSKEEPAKVAANFNLHVIMRGEGQGWVDIWKWSSMSAGLQSLPSDLKIGVVYGIIPMVCVAIGMVKSYLDQVYTWLIRWKAGTIGDSTWDDRWSINSRSPKATEIKGNFEEFKSTWEVYQLEQREFRKEMLAWMKQHDPEFFSLPEFDGVDPQGWIQRANCYFYLNGISSNLRIELTQLSMSGVAKHWFTIITQIYEDMSWEQFQVELLQRFNEVEISNSTTSSLTTLGLPVLDEVGDEHINKQQPYGEEEVAVTVSDSDSKSKTAPSIKLPQFLISPLQLTKIKAKIGRTIRLISNQGRMREKFKIHFTLQCEGKNPNRWVVTPERIEDYRGYLSVLKLGVTRQRTTDQAINLLGRPPPPPPPPPPPLSPEIEEKNGGTLERQMTESQRSLWEKEAPFNCRLEWRYLGYSEIGVIEKVNPHIIKCFKIAATAKPPGSSSTLLFMCNSESISEMRKKDSYKLCSTDDLFWVAILSVHVDALIPFDKMNQQRNPTSTTKSICQVIYVMIDNEIDVDNFKQTFKVFVRKNGVSPSVDFFNVGFKTYSNRGYENKTRALMARMKTGNNWQPKFDSYHIVLGGYMDCKKKSALHTMLNQINVKMQDLFDKLWGRNSNKKIALGSCFRNTNTVGADVSMMRQWGVGLYSTYLFTEKYVVRALIKEDITKYVCNVPGDNVGFKVKNVVVKYLKHRYVTSNSKEEPAKGAANFKLHMIMRGEGQGWVDIWKWSSMSAGLQSLPSDLKIGVVYGIIPMVFVAIGMVKSYLDQVHTWLIRWKAGTIGDSTWDDRWSINSRSPKASLEDKTFWMAGVMIGMLIYKIILERPKG